MKSIIYHRQSDEFSERERFYGRWIFLCWWIMVWVENEINLKCEIVG